MRLKAINRRTPSKVPIGIRILRTLGLTTAIIAGAYFYQPQRYDFFPKPVPQPNPPIDPDTPSLFSKNSIVAIVAAHPDDPEYYIGGTLLKLSEAGAKISIVMCTDGDKGYYPWFMTDARKNRIVRRAEQLEAARHYHANVYFLARLDGRLKADAALDDAVGATLAKIKPNYLICFDRDYPPRIQHSDHMQSGIAALSVASANLTIQWILRYATHAPNYVVDVSKQWQQREELLAIHRSQFSGEKLDQVRSTIEDRSAEEGGLRNYDYGEAFRVSRNPPMR